jgi:hypothetical protein
MDKEAVTSFPNPVYSRGDGEPEDEYASLPDDFGSEFANRLPRAGRYTVNQPYWKPTCLDRSASHIALVSLCIAIFACVIAGLAAAGSFSNGCTCKGEHTHARHCK